MRQFFFGNMLHQPTNQDRMGVELTSFYNVTNTPPPGYQNCADNLASYPSSTTEDQQLAWTEQCVIDNP